MTYEVFKLKGLFEQVRNEFIRGAKMKLGACLAMEAAEKAERKVAEKVVAEVTARKEAEKAVAEAAAREKVEAEAALVVEDAQKATEDV